MEGEHTLLDALKYSKKIGKEIHGVVLPNGNCNITTIGTSDRVMSDMHTQHTFHTHLTEDEDIKIFAGCDPPSSQDYVMVVNKLASCSTFESVSDTVVSKYGTWRFEAHRSFVESDRWKVEFMTCIEYFRGYYHWLNLMLMSGYISVNGYINLAENFSPQKLSGIAREFIDNEGEEGRSYVYSETEVVHGTCLYPSQEDELLFDVVSDANKLCRTLF